MVIQSKSYLPNTHMKELVPEILKEMLKSGGDTDDKRIRLTKDILECNNLKSIIMELHPSRFELLEIILLIN